MVDGQKVGFYISLGLIVFVLVLAGVILKPIILSIFTGMIIAYVLKPVNKRILKFVKEKNTASLITCFLLLLLVVVPIWFLMPFITRQIFNAYLFLQKADFGTAFKQFFPFSAEISTDFYALINTFINKLANSLLSKSTSLILNFQSILLHGIVIFFVLFFTLRDWDSLYNYLKTLSPLSAKTEELFFHKFEEVTHSILFGQIIVGIFQGLIAGIGYLIFGVSNALSLTLLSIFFGIIPMVGPAIVWIPVSLFLFVHGETTQAIGLFVYGLLVVSTIDNILRSWIVSKQIKINAGIVLIGMIGGLYVFGILGLLLGPLILAYSLIILDLYRNKQI